jgi:tryptophan synthase alpha chain
MLERLERQFTKGKVLIPYMMVGFPDFNTSLSVFEILLQYGDILEVGYPFSDPVADGTTIQQAHQVALENGIGFKDVLKAVEILRNQFPTKGILVMSYYNPIFRIGLKKFVESFKKAGADGFIVPDLPPEESQPLKEITKANEMALIMLAAPTSTPKRLKLICEHTDVFTYYVSITGITGEREKLPIQELKEKISVYREICPKKIVVGFGISKPEQAREISKISDGIVIGSHFVRLAGTKNLSLLEKSIASIKSVL